MTIHCSTDSIMGKALPVQTSHDQFLWQISDIFWKSLIQVYSIFDIINSINITRTLSASYRSLKVAVRGPDVMAHPLHTHTHTHTHTHISVLVNIEILIMWREKFYTWLFQKKVLVPISCSEVWNNLSKGLMNGSLQIAQHFYWRIINYFIWNSGAPTLYR
jgi:hypothetical protein